MTPPAPASRPGLPDPSTVVQTIELRPPAPAAAGARAGAPKQTYRILRTNQVDEYERAPTKVESIEAPAAMKKAGDNFAGTARKAAKLSIASGQPKSFKDVAALIKSLPAEQSMEDQNISTDASSGRVQDEERNAQLTAWIYAQSRESDNDFHLILGGDPAHQKQVYMTMEISGLPPKSAESYDALKQVRETFMNFFGDNLPGTGYDFPDPPIKVEIGGSLFFDQTHATGGRPGPKDLRANMPVIWEVHPVTTLKFEP